MNTLLGCEGLGVYGGEMSALIHRYIFRRQASVQDFSSLSEMRQLCTLMSTICSVKCPDENIWSRDD